MKRRNDLKIIVVVFTIIISFNLCSSANCAQPPFSKGETIDYNIKKFGIKVGEASLVFNGPVEVANQKALSITFTAQGFKFFDEEQIYLDPETFYPILIKRDLDIFGKKEQINEFYDPKRGKVRIVKTAKGKTSQQILERGERFDNIYGFIYRHRQFGQFHKGEEVHLHLPTMDVRFELVKKKKFVASDTEFEAYFVQSVPKKYEVLFDEGKQRIPLKIDGTLGFGSMTMVYAGHHNDN